MTQPNIKPMTLRDWLKAHPVTAVIFATAFGALAACIGLQDHWAETVRLVYVGLALIFAGLMGMRSKALPIILALALLLPAKAMAQEESGTGGGPAGCVARVVAVAVICVGGYCIAKLVKFCQKHFPKDDPAKTNSPPAELTFALDGGYGGGDTEAAAFNVDPIGSCFCEEAGGSGGGGAPNATTFTMMWSVGHGAEPGEAALTCLSMKAGHGPEAVQDWASFAAQVRSYGVTVTGQGGDYSYARNGQPIDASASPISWDPVRRLVKIARGSETYYTVVVERSPDLKTWTPVLSVEAEVGTVLQVQDTNPTSQMFYRSYGFLSD